LYGAGVTSSAIRVNVLAPITEPIAGIFTENWVKWMPSGAMLGNLGGTALLL
jgi:hypothetical protein